MKAKLKPQWVLAPLDGKTNLGMDIIKGATYTGHGIHCQADAYDLLPAMVETSKVWSVENTGDAVTFLQMYDVMSVIHDVSAVVLEDCAELPAIDGFVRADAIGDYVCGVRSMEGVINNVVYGFSCRCGIRVAEKKRAKYNGWLETALKASIPNSLVSG